MMVVAGLSASIPLVTSYRRIGLWTLVHFIVIAIYAIPVFYPSEYNARGHAVLDELHIVSGSNNDVNGRVMYSNTKEINDNKDNKDNNSNSGGNVDAMSIPNIWSVIYRIFSNDYWGRPMNSPNSHKSWRPLSVLLFRFVRGIDTGKRSSSSHLLTRIERFWSSDLNVYRLVNILTHATVAEMVSIIASKLLYYTMMQSTTNGSTNIDTLLLRCIVKILWSLHPTHVEVTANAANRPHLLALLCSLFASDPDTPWVLFVIAVVAGYLVCETFLFQIVPAGATMVAIHYVRLFHKSEITRQHGCSQINAEKQKHGEMAQQTLLGQFFIEAILRSPNVFSRLVVLLISAIAYYYLRYQYDTLSIPTGLIRPAENPFYQFTGAQRLRNYLYVLSIHVAKQWNWDFIGFSHEYGYECIKSIDHWYDKRLLISLFQWALHFGVGVYLLLRQRYQSTLSISFILYFVHISWTVTLFPVAGVIKIGTFIADRLVVASTVSVSIIWGHVATQWIQKTSSSSAPPHKTVERSHNSRAGLNNQKLVLFMVLSLIMWRRIYQRTCEWLDPLPLLESSLRTCPRFAKAHLEISKIYSGLYTDKFNLTKSRWHLQQVEDIDPNYCDVNYQIAHVAVQEHNFFEFEQRLMNALLCPFTLGGSIESWKRYWNIALDPIKNSPHVVQEAQKRYSAYQKRINDAIVAEDEVKESTNSNKNDKSPLVVGWNK